MYMYTVVYIPVGVAKNDCILQLWYANAHADPDSETPEHSACMRALRIRI